MLANRFLRESVGKKFFLRAKGNVEKKRGKGRSRVHRIGSSVVIFSRDACDVRAAGTVRFPWEKRATTSAKSQRRASMMRRDTGATGKNARSRPLFSATVREDNGISLTLFARASHTTAINRIDTGFVS